MSFPNLQDVELLSKMMCSRQGPLYSHSFIWQKESRLWETIVGQATTTACYSGFSLFCSCQRKPLRSEQVSSAKVHSFIYLVIYHISVSVPKYPKMPVDLKKSAGNQSCGFCIHPHPRSCPELCSSWVPRAIWGLPRLHASTYSLCVPQNGHLGQKKQLLVFSENQKLCF